MLGSVITKYTTLLGSIRAPHGTRGRILVRAESKPRISLRTRFSGRMYDTRVFTGRHEPQGDEDRPMRISEKAVEDVRKALLKRYGPRPAKPKEPEPWVPYYRKSQGRYGDPKEEAPMTYRFAEPYTTEQLAKDQNAFKSWQAHLDQRRKVNEVAVQKRKGVGADMQLVGTMDEADPVRFKKGEREREKKLLDPSMEFKDHGFDYDWDSQTYSINGTIMPQKFDHWVEDPGSVKTSRDLRMLKKIERAKEKAAAKHRLKQMGTTQRTDQEIEKRHLVTRRMLRVSNMILEELGKALSLLPNYLSRQKVTKYGKETRSIALPESMLITSGAVSFTNVEISRDLLHAKIFWEAEESHVALVEKELDRATAALRHLITQAVHMKFSPELVFVRETTSQRQREVNEIMKNVESSYNNYIDSIDSPYIPAEPAPVHSAIRMDVHLAKPSSSDPIVLPIQEKLIRSRWTVKVSQPPAYQTWKPPVPVDEESPASSEQPK